MLNLTKQLLVLPKEEYIIFLNSKCASSAIRRMAMHCLGYGEPLMYLKTPTELEKYKDFKWLYVIREPFERLKSLWNHKVSNKAAKSFQLLGFESGWSFDQFARHLEVLPMWSLVDSHLWPLFYLYGYFLTNHNGQIVDIKDWKNWPEDLPIPKPENVLNSSESPGKLTERGSDVLKNKYIFDFILYKELHGQKS